jgi:protein-L-isoaspartate O-methyltransferase
MAPKEGRPYYDTTGVYVTDAKRVDPPAPSPRSELPARKLDVPPPSKPQPPAKVPTAFDAMAESLKAGVQVVSADQLFPTPPELAARIVALADLEAGQHVLEPSAGTGRLLRAALGTPGVDVVAVEIRENLARALAPKPGESYSVRQGDFLTLGPKELGTFDRVIMNPPFAGAADVKHILHARALLKPGGKLVAVCANGPNQRKALKHLADTWEDLPEGSFKASGTNVRTVLLTMKAPS